MLNRVQNRFVTRSGWILLLSASMLSGCVVGPNYHRPAVQTPPAFHEPDQSQQLQPQSASIADLPWWQVFHDPQLQELIRMALKQNYDLQLAVERVNAARAQVGITRSNEFPQVSLDPNFSGGKTDQNIKSNVFQLAGDVVFQVDLFGRYRRETEAARAQLLGTEDAQQTVVLTLVSDVASDYFLLRDLDLQLQITQDTVRTQEDSVKLTQLRLQHGIATTLDVLQARQVLDIANAQIPDLERQIGQTEDAINILLGKYPNSVPRGQALGIGTPEGWTWSENLSPQLPAGLPSELLERRPDIREAEHEPWLLPTQTLASPKRCSSRRSRSSVPGARRSGIASFPDRISRPLSELEPTQQPHLSHSLRAALCATTCATPGQKNVKL